MIDGESENVQSEERIMTNTVRSQSARILHLHRDRPLFIFKHVYCSDPVKAG